jgi:hydrogenase maturation factor
LTADREDDVYDSELGLGKVSQEVMKRSVFPFLPLREEPGLDAGMIELSGRTAIAHSPSIGVPIDALGFFAFHYAASNVSARFARPRHLVVGIYLPLSSRERELRRVVAGLGGEAERYGVTVAAGQTATYYGLEIPLVTATCLGEQLRETREPIPGDAVMLAGSLGGEALWLKGLSEGRPGEGWKDFTPLPAALLLQEQDGVRLMHDVSEGGLKKALHEVASETGAGMEIDSGRIPYAEGACDLGVDVLRAPTYGCLIAIVDPDSVERVKGVLSERGIPCSAVGEIAGGEGLYVDGSLIEELGRVSLDEIYGTFRERSGSKVARSPFP